MAETHYAKVVWSGGAFGPTKSVANYSREFRAEFEGKPPIHGSGDPAFHGDPPLYNPEDLLMSALSACHMLSYLAVCIHAGIAVVSYEDSVVGTVARRGTKLSLSMFCFIRRSCWSRAATSKRLRHCTRRRIICA
jgi:organic hydroperoxide reductase OsmC/OhrA